MELLYENHRRARKARLGILGAVIWSLGWFYWAYVLSTGGTRAAAVGMVIAVGVAPFVALHFYGNVYVVRIARDGDMLDVTTLGLFRNRSVRLPLTAVGEVMRPEVGGMTMQIAGQRTPFIIDLQAEHADVGAIAALGRRAGG